MSGASIGLFAFFFIMYVSTEEKLKKKTAEYKKLKKKNRELGGSAMSKMINELVGKSCNMRLVSDVSAGLRGCFGGGSNTGCDVIDADEEWVKVSYSENPKKDSSRTITIMIRIEDIVSVEIL